MIEGIKRGFSSWGLIILGAVLLLLFSCGKTMKQKVFVLGIDGLTFDLLLPWVQEGKLPHFARLLEEGSSTQLVSTIPPSSPPAWTSAITGVNPGKHDIFGFIKGIQPGQGRPELIYYTAADRMADPLWVILSERQRRSVVVNVPCSSPPDSLLGVMISGFPHTSPTDFTFPPDYRLQIPDYRTDLYGQVVPVDGEVDFLAYMNEVMERRVEATFKLLEEEPWDLFFVVFTITDRVQHYFWKFMDPEHPHWEAGKAKQYGDVILETYQKMDRLLGRLRDRLDDQTTLLVMSDHGFGPVYQPINGQNFIDLLELPEEIGVMSADQFGAKFYFALGQDLSDAHTAREVYSRGRELLKRNLEQLRDPATGRQVIAEIFEKEDLYWGPYAHRAPDLQALEAQGYLFWNWQPTGDQRIFPEKGAPGRDRFFSGFHRLNGALIMAGANVVGGTNNFDARIFDMAPTVMYLLGEPVPEDMDGKILQEPISPKYIREHPVDARWTRAGKPRKKEVLTDSIGAVNKYIEEQLRAIGYVQ